MIWFLALLISGCILVFQRDRRLAQAIGVLALSVCGIVAFLLMFGIHVT